MKYLKGKAEVRKAEPRRARIGVVRCFSCKSAKPKTLYSDGTCDECRKKVK